METEHTKPELDLVEKAEYEKDGNNDSLVPPTAEEEAAVLRKLDWRLMPIIFTIYMLSVLDRSNLGNAHVAGLDEGIHLTGWNYNMLGTVFYIGYILSQWTAAGWKQFPAHIWCPCVVFTWSSISSIQAAVQNYAGLVTLRFLLGVFEAMYAGVPLYLSFFYPRDKVGFRQGIFLSGSALANAYGGALGYAILKIKSHLASWRILFLIEGLPTYIMVVVAFLFLPDDLSKANFLTDREKAIAIYRIKQGQIADTEQHAGLRWTELKAAFTDWRSMTSHPEKRSWLMVVAGYLPGIMYFSCNVSFASLPLFVPTIISEIGVFTRIQSNGLSAPPYLLCFFMILLVCFTSDRIRLRGPFVSLFGFVAAVGFILLATTTAPAPRYIGIYLAITIFVSIALLISWVSNIHSTESKRTGGWAIFATLGQCGPLVGTNLFPSSEGPYYRKGSLISMAFCLLVGVIGAVFSFLLWRENKKLDKAFREGNEESRDDVRTPRGFRYII